MCGTLYTLCYLHECIRILQIANACKKRIFTLLLLQWVPRNRAVSAQLARSTRLALMTNLVALKIVVPVLQSHHVLFVVFFMWSVFINRLQHSNSTAQSTDSVTLHHDVVATVIAESEERDELEFVLVDGVEMHFDWRICTMHVEDSVYSTTSPVVMVALCE